MKILVFIQVEKGKKFYTLRGLYRSFDELVKAVQEFLTKNFHWQKDKSS